MSAAPKFLIIVTSLLIIISLGRVEAQGTRLLRQPAISATEIAFEYGGDIWICQKDGSNVRRITSTPATEANPQFSPDGQWLAFSSNRSGIAQVYMVSSK